MRDGTFLREGETLDDLNHLGRRIIQRADGFRFAMDAVLLAHFAEYRARDVVLDLGTGSGVMPLLMAEEVARVDAVEIDEETADMARRSVAMNGLEGKISIITGDYRRLSDVLPKDALGHYDVVLSNPPYYKLGAGKESADDRARLARHEVAATLDDTVKAASLALRSRGRLELIHIAERLDEIMMTLARWQMAVRRMRLVQPSATRGANLVLIEAVKGAKLGAVKMMPTLIVRKDDGDYTDEFLRIYGVE
ncbi:MAG: tRNA1(Val) (adenine(37)-N6)-methyltransferase [Selenomonadaceae bacterium]